MVVTASSSLCLTLNTEQYVAAAPNSLSAPAAAPPAPTISPPVPTIFPYSPTTSPPPQTPQS